MLNSSSLWGGREEGERDKHSGFPSGKEELLWPLEMFSLPTIAMLPIM